MEAVASHCVVSGKGYKSIASPSSNSRLEEYVKERILISELRTTSNGC